MDQIQLLTNALQQELPEKASDIENVLISLDDDLKELLKKYVNVCIDHQRTPEYLAKSYVLFVNDVYEQSKYFFRNQGQYKIESYQKIKDDVYDNPDYMGKYMTGVAVSMFLWPQQRELYDFYKQFMTSYKGERKNYLEVGLGHGLFCYEAIRLGGFEHYDFLDISETSLKLTKDMIYEFWNPNRFSFIHTDFLQYQGNSYDVLSTGEVIDHVRDPLAFMEQCCRMINYNGRIYITASANAPHIDHVHLFREVNDMEILFSKAGLIIESKLIIPYQNYSQEQCERKMLPINMAYVLKKG